MPDQPYTQISLLFDPDGMTIEVRESTQEERKRFTFSPGMLSEFIKPAHGPNKPLFDQEIFPMLQMESHRFSFHTTSGSDMVWRGSKPPYESGLAATEIRIERMKEQEEEDTTMESTSPHCHYVAYNGRHLTALIIGQDSDEIGSKADLVVFTNMSNVNGVKNFGQQFHQDVEYSEEPRPGTYHWIEKKA